MPTLISALFSSSPSPSTSATSCSITYSSSLTYTSSSTGELRSLRAPAMNHDEKMRTQHQSLFHCSGNWNYDSFTVLTLTFLLLLLSSGMCPVSRGNLPTPPFNGSSNTCGAIGDFCWVRDLGFLVLLLDFISWWWSWRREHDN